MEKREVAAWRSRGGKYQVTLYADALGYTYQGTDCGGNLGAFPDDDAAIEFMQAQVATGRFQADANKTPMERAE